MLTLALPFRLGLTGLAVDLGRAYVVKSEAQSFVDAAALYSAVQLALNPGNFTNATSAAAGTPKTYQFASQPFTNVTTTFGTSPTDTFTASPPAGGHTASQYTFAKVTAQVSLPMWFLPVLTRSGSATVAASAMAGQAATTSVPGGEFPFSPWSHQELKNAASPDNALPYYNPNDPFGLTVGSWYTMRWSPPGSNTSCAGDLDKNGNVLPGLGANGKFRGYCCTGGQSVPSIRDVLAGGGTVPMSVGDDFGQYVVNGQKASINISDYVNLDSDPTCATYAAYLAAGTGNGKRIVIAPVNDAENTVSGFAAFFLAPGADDGSKNLCAEYIGQVVQGLPGLAPSGGSGVFHLKLYQ